jgi:hypothetical protein
LLDRLGNHSRGTDFFGNVKADSFFFVTLDADKQSSLSVLKRVFDLESRIDGSTMFTSVKLLVRPMEAMPKR